jgi:hypothetical protein
VNHPLDQQEWYWQSPFPKNIHEQQKNVSLNKKKNVRKRTKEFDNNKITSKNWRE